MLHTSAGIRSEHGMRVHMIPGVPHWEIRWPLRQRHLVLAIGDGLAARCRAHVLQATLRTL